MTVYEAIGEQGFADLVRAFYRRIPKDDLLGPMYPPEERAAAEVRLRDFLIYRFGGPQRYLIQRGPPQLRLRHHSFAITQAARDRWAALMDAALDETVLHPETRETLRQFLREAATFLINRA